MAPKNIQKLSIAGLSAILLIGASGSASAVLLTPGAPSVLSVASLSEPASTLLTSAVVNITGIYDINPASTISERVYRNNSTGFLDFYYQLTLAPASPTFNGAVHQFNANFFAGFTTDTFYDSSPVSGGLIAGAATNPLNGLAPGTGVPDTFARNSSGNAVQFNFSDPATAGSAGTGGLLNGATSKWLVIRTNATTFGPGIGGVINGVTVNLPLIGPVPEPATVLFGLGILGAMGTRGIRRRQASNL